MERFACGVCANEVRFDASTCPVCGCSLGYVPGERTLRTLEPLGDGVSYAIRGHAGTSWRCLNAAWGCNWVLPADSGATWCRSCALTRGRPDDGRPDAVDAWSRAESAKRRIIHQLDGLALPVEGRSPATPNGLVFDLVYLPGERGLTGHLDGVVTLDLAEADDRRRDEIRTSHREPYRTLIGNLRHEIGHHYWHRLVGQSDDLGRARALFGDDRVDYAAALARHYGATDEPWDQSRFITRYAAAHPLEDWAETFAHYLHIVDVVETAAAFGLLGDDAAGAAPTETSTFLELLGQWRPLARAIDAIAEDVGSPPIYPFRPCGGAVADKLEFVHARVVAHTGREQFYASAADADSTAG
jgi:hypothetical protein